MNIANNRNKNGWFYIFMQKELLKVAENATLYRIQIKQFILKKGPAKTDF